MSIIDCEAFKRDGMKAYENALLALEAAVEAQARDLNGLYAAQGYQNDRRKDERAIRNEIDGRLRVVEEQVTRMAEALRAAQVELETLHRDVAELTTDTQTDLRILQARMEAQQCAVCGKAGDSKLCPECRADVRAGIEDAGLAGMRVRRPRATHRDWQQTAGSYCPECRAVVMWGASRWRTCEYCGAELEPVTSVRNDAMPAFPHRLLDPFAYPAMRVAASNNGADHDGEMA